MKTFLYHENGWRMFQAEKLPVKPIITDIFKSDMSLANRSRIYESEIAALKAKSIPMGNPEILNAVTTQNGFLLKVNTVHYQIETNEFYELLGGVDIVKTLHCDEYHSHTKSSCFVEVAILTLPKEQLP